MRQRIDPEAPLEVPFTVVIDTREQSFYQFTGLRADARQHRRPLVVPTARAGLSSGDYSIQGYETRVAVERKSTADLFATLGQERHRFERELARLAAYDYSAVVVEADWLTVLTKPPARSQLNPKTVFRTVVAWQQRYPGTHWWFCPGRRFAEVVTFRILERFYRDREAGKTAGSSFATWRGRQRATALLQQYGPEDDFDLTEVDTHES